MSSSILDPQVAFTQTSIPRPLPYAIEEKILRMVHGLGNIVEVFLDHEILHVNSSASPEFRIFSAITLPNETATSRRIITGWRTPPIFTDNPTIVVPPPAGAPSDFVMGFHSSYILFFSPIMTIEQIKDLIDRMKDGEKERIQHVAVHDRLWLMNLQTGVADLLTIFKFLPNLLRVILVSELLTEEIDGLGPLSETQDKVEFITPFNAPRQMDPFSYSDRKRDVESQLSQFRALTQCWLLGEIYVEVVAVERNGTRCASDYRILSKAEMDRELELEREREARFADIENRVYGPEDPSDDDDSFDFSDFEEDDEEADEEADEKGDEERDEDGSSGFY